MSVGADEVAAAPPDDEESAIASVESYAWFRELLQSRGRYVVLALGVMWLKGGRDRDVVTRGAWSSKPCLFSALVSERASRSRWHFVVLGHRTLTLRLTARPRQTLLQIHCLALKNFWAWTCSRCLHPASPLLNLRFTALWPLTMGTQKKTRKFASVKRIIGQRDARLKKNQDKAALEVKKKKDEDVIREV